MAPSVQCNCATSLRGTRSSFTSAWNCSMVTGKYVASLRNLCFFTGFLRAWFLLAPAALFGVREGLLYVQRFVFPKASLESACVRDERRADYIRLRSVSSVFVFLPFDSFWSSGLSDGIFI